MKYVNAMRRSSRWRGSVNIEECKKSPERINSKILRNNKTSSKGRKPPTEKNKCKKCLEIRRSQKID